MSRAIARDGACPAPSTNDISLPHPGSGGWPETITPLATELITNEEELGVIKSAWDELHAVAAHSNPFTEWSWMWHWWNSLGRHDGLRRDRLHVLVQRDAAGIARAIFPLIATRIGFGPLAISKLRFFGSASRVNITEMPAPLVWPGWERSSFAALTESLHAHRRTYHWCDLDGLVLDGLVMEGPVGQALLAHSARWSWRTTAPYYVLALPDTWETFRAGRKRNIKESLRHCYNSLARDGHAWSFEAVSEPRQLPEALDQFFRLHGSRATSNQGPAHQNHFPGRAHQDFLRRVSHDLAVAGRLMVCRLRVNDAIVASRIVFSRADEFYLYYSGFDPAWARYSVATTLQAECIKLAIATGIRTVNLSPGKDVSKMRWSPEEHWMGSLRIGAPTAVGRAIADIHRRSAISRPLVRDHVYRTMQIPDRLRRDTSSFAGLAAALASMPYESFLVA